MFCKNCGHEIPDGSVKCAFCGKVLISVSQGVSNLVNQAGARAVNSSSSANVGHAAAQKPVVSETAPVASAVAPAVSEPEFQKYNIDNSGNSDLVNTLNKEIERLSAEINEYKEKIEESREEIESLNQRIRESNDNIAQYNIEIKGREEQIAAVKNTISVLA